VIDGQLGPEYDAGWVAGVVFSPDSRHAAYVGKRGEKKFVVLDGKELAPHDSADGIRILFSPDSRRLAYIAYRGQKDDAKAYFVVDGQEGPEHGDHIWDVFFSPDSQHVAYIAINGRWQDSAHTEQMVVDGKEGPVVGRVESHILNGVVWSSDSQHLAYVASQGGTEWVVVDGVAGPKYTSVSGLEFSPDGKHLAYIAHTGGGAYKYMVVRDGQAGPAFDKIETSWQDQHLFSPDGRHIAYKVTRGDKHAVVLDDQVGPEFNSVLCYWFHVWPWVLHEELRWARTPRFLPSGAVQYPAVKTGKPNELYIVTQSPAAGSAPDARR
jgi:WD40 repeat protein